MSLFSRRHQVFALVAAVSINPVFMGAASAYTVSPDTEAMVCRVDPHQADSEVVQFWKKLHDDARAQRLDQLDAADPGLKAEIAKYAAGDPTALIPGDLQRRLSATGAFEGLGELVDVEGGDPNELGQVTSTYTEEEARKAASAIGDNPAGVVLEKLRSQGEAGTELDRITAELFSQRTAEYNVTQADLKASLNACADALKDARPMSLGMTLTLYGVIVAIFLVALRAIYNAKRPTKHSAHGRR